METNQNSSRLRRPRAGTARQPVSQLYPSQSFQPSFPAQPKPASTLSTTPPASSTHTRSSHRIHNPHAFRTLYFPRSSVARAARAFPVNHPFGSHTGNQAAASQVADHSLQRVLSHHHRVGRERAEHGVGSVRARRSAFDVRVSIVSCAFVRVARVRGASSPTVLCSRLSETVADVKIAIERRNHVSRHDQRLLLGERQLSDDEVLLKLHTD